MTEPQLPETGLSIESRVSRTETRVDSIFAALDRLTRAVEALSDRVSYGGRTNWMLVIAAISVAFSMWTLISSSYQSDQMRHREDLKRVESTQTEIITREFARLQAEAKTAREDAQKQWERGIAEGRREERILALEARVAKFDVDIQREVRDLLGPVIQRVEANADSIRKLLDYNATSHEIHAEQKAQIRQLLDERDRLMGELKDLRNQRYERVEP